MCGVMSGQIGRAISLTKSHIPCACIVTMQLLICTLVGSIIWIILVIDVCKCVHTHFAYN